jgi:16S rRNA (guanine966-N2)-methyltransferase
VRIVAGRFRGRRLVAPRGQAVRPTADRTREALFDLLAGGRLSGGADPVMGARVLDAFAGTGALGLEALSRGAEHATFLENDRAALAALHRNIQAFGVEAEASVRSVDVLNPPSAAAPCTLVLMDPPYGQSLAAPALAALARAGWIADRALCLVELAAREDFQPPPRFTPLDERRYGAARLVFLRLDPDDTSTRR